MYSLLFQLNKALKKSNTTLQAATDARDAARKVLEDAVNATTDLSHSLEKIANFLNQDKATPDQVRTVSISMVLYHGLISHCVSY